MFLLSKDVNINSEICLQLKETAELLKTLMKKQRTIFAPRLKDHTGSQTGVQGPSGVCGTVSGGSTKGFQIHSFKLSRYNFFNKQLTIQQITFYFLNLRFLYNNQTYSTFSQAYIPY